MHTTTIHEGHPTEEIRIHHNGDWSGDAHVTWGPAHQPGTPAPVPQWRTLRLPGSVAKAMLDSEPDSDNAAPDLTTRTADVTAALTALMRAFSRAGREREVALLAPARGVLAALLARLCVELEEGR